MPYKSLKQERFFHTAEGKAKLGPKKVAEFDAASKGLDLPKFAKPEKPLEGRKYRDIGGRRGVK